MAADAQPWKWLRLNVALRMLTVAPPRPLPKDVRCSLRMRSLTDVLRLPCANWLACRAEVTRPKIRELYVRVLHALGIPLPHEETAGRHLLVSLAFGFVKGELNLNDVAARLSTTDAARTREETRFLSIAADYSEWISPTSSLDRGTT